MSFMFNRGKWIGLGLFQGVFMHFTRISSGEGNHNTLFLADRSVLCVRDSATLSIPVSTSFEVQILVEIEGHFIRSHTILSLHIP